MNIDTGPLTLENLHQQFCSDWLKDEIRKLFEKNVALEAWVTSYAEPTLNRLQNGFAQDIATTPNSFAAEDVRTALMRLEKVRAIE